MRIPSSLAAIVLASVLLAGCRGQETPQPEKSAANPEPLAPAPAPQAAAPEKPAAAPAEDANRSLAARVKRALDAAPKLSAQGVEITARRGVVSLFGAVDTQDIKTRMEQVAASVDGVQSVDSQLRVVAGS